ncbi:MAG TPA: sugar transferase [Acidimicrobiales bacterium]|nr:sugar transferase [Acidimicrobiales bacterium]
MTHRGSTRSYRSDLLTAYDHTLQAFDLGTAVSGGLDLLEIEGAALAAPGFGLSANTTQEILEGTEQAAPLAAVKPLDPGSRYALEHSGVGPSDLIADCVGLLLAAFALSLARAADARMAGHPLLASFLYTFVPLALCVPLLAAVLGSTRRRSLLGSVFSDQVHALALPLAGGGLVALTTWRLVSMLGVESPNLDWMLTMCAVSLVSVAGVRVAHHRGDRAGVQRVLIVGSGEVADRVAQQMAQAPGVEVVGYVDDDPVDPTRCLGRLDALSGICERERVGHLVVAFSRSQPREIIDALRPMQGRLPITVVPRLFEVVPANARLHELGSGLPGLSVAPATLGPWPRAVKLTVDVTAAAVGLVLLSPLLAVVALAVRLTSRGPIFYRQARVGRKGQEFSMLKFRTMTVENAGASPAKFDGEVVVGPFPKLKDDPRVTPIGRLLRRTSIDELPQLWNVLRGEMALVGPRPFMLDDAAAINGWALRRYSVRPGITGLWQVSGRNELTFADMCRLDQLYVNCWSIGLDLRILLRTLWVVLGGRGAY